MEQYRVLVSRPRHVYQGRIGTVVDFTAHGYVRLRLDGDPQARIMLISPTSVQFLDGKEPAAFADACAAFRAFTARG